ncbi:hypothetical protein [Ochrovirga pacifica]|uniref:hypothetical protein n=1 Tax=Ochrovirga pacifica TaxID=1042376 RepID=UPI0002558EA0|nr:hypothetical protein [Ochrovirga pacifica]
MEEKSCLECGERIVGRSDKKFCNDYCRNAYNNKLNVGDKNLVRNTNNALKKNYKILCELNPTGKTKLNKTVLLQKGFNFQLFTSIYTTKTGNQYFYCYNQGYLLLENDFVLLVKNNQDF